MSDELRDRLRSAPLPGAEDARRRAWGVVRAAATEPRPRSGGRHPAATRRRRQRAAAGLIATAGVAFALTPAGAAVGEWVRDRVDPPAAQPAATPAVRLPAPGRLLVRDGLGVTVVGHDGGRVRLGRYDGATWSPHGLFAAAWRGDRLSAVTPTGALRWTITAPDPIVAARWSPDPGYRIAYVTAAGELRIVAGDGTGDRLLARAARRAAPAWRPGGRTEVAYVAPDGTLAIRDADTGALAGRSRRPLPRGVRTLAWSAGGSRIAAAGPAGVRITDLRPPRTDVRIPAPPRARLSAAAFAPTRPSLARVARARGRSLVLVGARAVYATRGRIAGLAWSPDGRWLMLDTPDAGQLVAVRIVGPPRVLSFPGGRLQGWSR